MSFIQTIQRAGDLLRQQGRISLRALRLEFGLDDEQLEALVEELVEIQQVAAREGKAIAWIGTTSQAGVARTSAQETTAPEPSGEGERRQLTVLFCDLVDSTAIAAGMDAEDWRELVLGYQAVVASLVERFDGHVAQYLGDGVLVYFGWPRAHEDDAERAVRAGLEIAEAAPEHDTRLAVRVGIHTGPVVVGEIGAGRRREMLAVGDTTNVAARLQGVAEPGQVVLSSTTLRLVAGIFVTQDLGEPSLKGVGAGHVHRALRPSGMRSRLDVLAATGLTPLVGRERELGLLEDRFAQVAEGIGQGVLLSGDAGIGKSRLVQAFRERIADRGHSWLECRCSPYSQDSALLPVLELQRQGLGLGPEVPVELRVERLELGIEQMRIDPAEAMPLMARFHGLPLPGRYSEPLLSAEARRKKTMELLVEWLLRLGRLQPMVLLMEDLHWADPSTQELMGQVFDRIAREQVLVIATFRPDFEPPWEARSHLIPMQLARLTRADLADVIRKAAGSRDLSEEWVDQIVQRCDGVPLFAEELTKAVLESHTEPTPEGELPELHVPESLQDSLTARLDALGPVKELAQVGAVLGREFDYPLLLAVSSMKEVDLQRVLEAAVREELLYQRGRPPSASYLFKHALIRDAAYSSLLRATRQRLHLRVAETLLDRMPEIGETQPELVAHHLSEAAAIDRAIQWWRRAGERANTAASYEESVRHCSRGLALLDGLGDPSRRDASELDLQMALGRGLNAVRGWGHPDTRHAWERARTLCDPVAEPLRAGAIYWSLISNHNTRGDSHAALECAQELLGIGDSGGQTLRIAGQFLSGITLFFLGRFAESRESLEAAVSGHRPHRHRMVLAELALDVGVGVHTWLAWADWALGFSDRAWATATSAVEDLRQSAGPFGLAAELAWLSSLATLRRDWRCAEKLGGEAVRLAAEHGFPMYEGISRLNHLLGVEAERGMPEVVDAYVATLAPSGGSENRGAAPLLLANLAGLQLRADRAREAWATAERALEIAHQTGQSFYDAELQRLKGEICLQRGGDGENQAESLFHEAIEISESQEARLLHLRALTSLARLWKRQGKQPAARHLLGPVYDSFTEGHGTRDLEDARSLLTSLA